MKVWAGAAATILFAALISLFAATTPRNDLPERTIGAYTTDLQARSPAQRHNARLAGNRLHGSVIAPGREFSFNHTVSAWNFASGYRKAPVSYEGRLVGAFGGGVCQVSTTLYNAALIAGMPIRERHRHAVAPSYVPPGRDAAVAYDTLDLRLLNTLPTPIRIEVEVRSASLTVRLRARTAARPKYSIVTRVLSTTEPTAVLVREPQGQRARPYSGVHSPGQTGWRVVTYRCTEGKDGVVGRERISDDSYRSLDNVRLGPTGGL